VEASALPATVGLARSRLAFGAPLLRLRSDEQLVSLFRAGNDEAFRVIHDRYRARMLAYTRQMLAGSPQDPEDAVQEIFVRAYSGLRANRRELALRAWLYRIAHNRCVDELRRPHAIALEAIDSMIPGAHDPVAKVEQRDSLRRLIADVQRLPEQQRSALLMREMSGMAYADVAGALGVSVPAVKSLLVRARLGLAQANEARDTACAEIREDLIASHDRGVRASGLARRHMRDCRNCREFRTEVRGVSRRFAALTPTLGPIGVIANLLGWGGGGGAAAGGGAVAGSGTAAAGSGAAASAGVLAGGTGHVVTLLAAAVVATGGAVEIQHTLATPSPHRAQHHRVVTKHQADPDATPASTTSSSSSTSSPTHVTAAAASAVDVDPAAPTSAPARAMRPGAPRASGGAPSSSSSTGQPSSGHTSDPAKTLPIAETLDPDNMMYGPNASNGTASASGTATTGSTSGSSATGSSTPGATTSGTSTGGTTGTSTAATTSGSGTSGTAGTTGTSPASPTPIGSSTGTGTSGGGSGMAPGGSGGSGSGDGTTSAGSGAGPASAVGSTSSTGAGSISSFEQSR
jgi:RNA polymerase sigma factor (sigma-70 family)